MKDKIGWILAAVFSVSEISRAQESAADPAAELAKKLANPVASLISVPLQYNYDENFGPAKQGEKSLLNIQPVWPFALNRDWNLITRTIIPLVDQHDIPPGTDESGLGDILQSFFFSPAQPVKGWVTAAGPVILYPSASDEVLGGQKWGAGPTALALKQDNGWTYGILANHVASFAGDDDRAYVSSTFIQPFLSYITRTKTTLGLNAESTYDWRESQWAVPINGTIAQLFKIGPRICQFTLGARYWAESPDNGPEDWGYRAQFTFLFPK